MALIILSPEEAAAAGQLLFAPEKVLVVLLDWREEGTAPFPKTSVAPAMKKEIHSVTAKIISQPCSEIQQISRTAHSFHPLTQ